MINKEYVAATLQAFEDILAAKGVPFEVRDDEETKIYREIWDECAERESVLKKIRPAIERIASKEPFLFETEGEPLCIRLNYLNRKLERDSFGEILLERPDINWRFSISIKSDADVLSSMPVADRDYTRYGSGDVSVANEIDDFGDRIFGVPCSNEYFDDVNDVLMKIEPLDRETWRRLLADEKFAQEKLITPMLRAIGFEMPRIFKYHPEAPQKLIDYFYGRIDYYFIKPIDELEITRIGAVNAHGGLGCMPANSNHTIPMVRLPNDLLDVRFATGKYGEISNNTIQFSFDGGWAVCFRIVVEDDPKYGREFKMRVYLPVTPFGSYRDQVAWD